MRGWRVTGSLLLPLLAAMGPTAQAAEAPVVPADEAPSVQPPAETAPVATPEAAEAAAEPQAAPPAPLVEAEPEAQPTATTAPATGLAIHGYLKSRYIFRATDGEVDNDLQNIVMLNIGDKARDRITGHLVADLMIDLDGHTDENGYYPFDRARDAMGPVSLLVYSAYADVNRVDNLSILRIGRQSLYKTPEVAYFDGLRIETEEHGAYRLMGGVYAGFPVEHYENDDTLGVSAFDQPADLIGGIYAEGHLWQGARTRADLQYLEGDDGGQTNDELLSSIGLWQRVGPLDFYGQFTLQDDESRDVQVRGTYRKAEWDLIIQASYYELLLARWAALVGTDAFYPIMKEYVPFREFRATASKGLGEHANLDVGMTLRRLVDNEESDFNHEFDRYYATLAFYDLIKDGSYLSLTLQRWDDQDKSIGTEGFEFSWPIDETYSVAAGTAHYLYKYDYYTDRERVDVQEYFLKVEREQADNLRMNASYTIEDDESSDLYHQLRCEVLWSF